MRIISPTKRDGLWYKILRAFYYQNVGVSWVDKPLKFRQEAFQIVTMLGVAGLTIWHVRFLVYILLAYLAVASIFMVIGLIAVKRGWVQYDTTLGNFQNYEIMEILKRLDKIEMSIKNIESKI